MNGELAALFQAAIDRHQEALDQNGLQARVSLFGDAPVLYIEKPHWNNRGPGIEKPSQIFFSVWLDERPGPTQKVKYNVHALRIRDLPGHQLDGKLFAAEFRKQFDQTPWPHVSLKFSPQTLFQGWETLISDRLDQLIHQFIGMHGLIDELLRQSESR